MDKDKIKMSVSATMPVEIASREVIIGWLRDASEIIAEIARRNEPGICANEFSQIREALDSAEWQEYFEIDEEAAQWRITAKKYPAWAVLLGLSILCETITKGMRK